MKQVIQLSEEEIKIAVIAYVGTQGVNIEGKTTDITFTASRKGSGHTAEIEVSDKTNKPRSKKTKVVAVSKETAKEIEDLDKTEGESETTEETTKDPEVDTTEVTKEVDNNAGTDGDDNDDGAEDEVPESTAKKSLFN